MEEPFGRGRERGEEGFEVSPEPESAAASPRFESLNVARVAALSALLGENASAAAGIATPLEEMGFPAALTTGRWSMRAMDPVGLLAELEVDVAGENRVDLWASTQEEPNPYSGVGFLVTVLGSPLERESAAAAAALWRLLPETELAPRRERALVYLAMEREEGEVEPLEWNAFLWRSLYEALMGQFQDRSQRAEVLDMLAGWRLVQALRSPDPLTVSLANAAGLPPTPPPLEPSPEGDGRESAGESKAGDRAVSTMIHGTWGWKGNWWRPGGGFHGFVLGGLRPNLYSQGARFSWSGFYRENHRRLACSDFCDWSETMAPDGLQSVFGHSFGGEVAARAVVEGAAIEELVLLSTPITDQVRAAVDRGVRVVDVRLRFDPVLALAWTGQRLPSRPNVTTVLLKRWSLDHSSTHDEGVWVREQIAKHGEL